MIYGTASVDQQAIRRQPLIAAIKSHRLLNALSGKYWTGFAFALLCIATIMLTPIIQPDPGKVSIHL